jgi:hypothetical protein
MAGRTAARWDALTPTYRARLLRGGITREDYIAGANLQRARGQSKEKAHSRQRYIAEKYGPTNRFNEPLITPKELRRARREMGDEWVTQRLEQMARDYKRAARSKDPIYPGDPQYQERADRITYEAGTNPNAPFWWYHGAFG